MDKSDTPRTDDLHRRLVIISEGPNWISGKDYVDMTDHARQLEREVTALTAANAALTAQLAEARRDAERVDWLETADGNFYNIDRISSIVGVGFNRQKTLRDAIDVAMKEPK